MQRTGKTRTDSPDCGDGMKDDSFEEYLTIPIKGRKIRLLVEGEVKAEILTSFGRYLRLVREDLPGDPAENRDGHRRRLRYPQRAGRIPP
jgi:hypothetical protein